MSKIVATFDTEEKSLVVTLDGEELQDVTYVSAGKSWSDEDDFCMSVSSQTVDEDKGVRRLMTVVACDSSEGRKALESGAKELKSLPGFVIASRREVKLGEENAASDAELEEAVASYFKD